MSESNYYWEKAEFQDKSCHAMNVQAYMNGRRVSEYFDEQYEKEAISELRKLIPERYDILKDPSTGDWFAYDNDEDKTMFFEDRELECYVGMIVHLKKGGFYGGV